MFEERSIGSAAPRRGHRGMEGRAAAIPTGHRDRDTLASQYMKRAENSWLFKYSRYDAIPVLAALAQLSFLIVLFVAFPHLPWWTLIPLGFVWSVSISWNINGISHNFLHNAYFKSAALNRAFSVLESVTVGFSQVFTSKSTRIITKETPICRTTADARAIRSRFTNMGTTECPRAFGHMSFFHFSAMTRRRFTARSRARAAAWRGGASSRSCCFSRCT